MNTKHYKPAPSTKLSPALLAVLRQWDDTDADTLAASKERLAALGPDASEQLAAFLRRRVRFCSAAAKIGVCGFVSMYIVFFGWVLPDHSHASPPLPISAAMAILACVWMVSGCIGGLAASGYKYRNGIKALAATNPSEAVNVLADIPLLFLDSSNGRSASELPASEAPLLMALQSLLNCDTMPPILLSKTQQRNLRSSIRGIRYTDLTVAVLQFFMRLDNGSAVPQARRVAKLSRVWEVREAANEYLERFAPEEARNLLSPDLPAMPRIEQGVTEEGTILSCVMGLGSRNAAERQAAQTELHNMNAPQLKQILQMLGQEPDGSRRISRAVSYGCTLAGMAVGSLTYLPCIRSPWYDTRMALTVAVGCAIAGGAISWLIGANINYGRRNRQRARMLGCEGGVFPAKRLLDTLEALENTALLDTLIIYLPSENSLDPDQLFIRKTLRQTIVRLLPRLGASDASLLGDEARNLLNRQLGRNKLALTDSWARKGVAEENAAYDVAILKAWEQVGDERALPFVENLAAQAALYPAHRRVEQAAQECLPYLQARADHQRIAQTLLRAAHAPAEPGDVLLRAAASSIAPSKRNSCCGPRESETRIPGTGTYPSRSRLRRQASSRTRCSCDYERMHVRRTFGRSPPRRVRSCTRNPVP